MKLMMKKLVKSQFFCIVIKKYIVATDIRCVEYCKIKSKNSNRGEKSHMKDLINNKIIKKIIITKNELKQYFNNNK